MAGNILPMVLLPAIIYDNNNNIVGVRVFIAALLMGVLGFIAFQFMIKNTEIRVQEPVKLHEKQPKFNVFKAMANFIRNRPAVGATVAAMGMFLGVQGATTAVTVLFQSYFQNVKILGIVQLFALLPIFLFTPLARKMVVKYGKKELATVGSLCSLVSCILMIILPITPDLKGLIIYIVCLFISSLGLGVYSTVSWAMMGDAIDYNEWKHGAREEGVTYSLHSFFRKLAQGVGPAVALVIMVALGYVEANEGNQTFDVALRMRYLVAALYTFSALLMYIGLGLIYNLDKKKLAKMNEELEAVRVAAEAEEKEEVN
jgi:GPH family glycoside/pentoside/hexuronide:cation symporter